jgi:hypothetical protein
VFVTNWGEDCRVTQTKAPSDSDVVIVTGNESNTSSSQLRALSCNSQSQGLGDSTGSAWEVTQSLQLGWQGPCDPRESPPRPPHGGWGKSSDRSQVALSRGWEKITQKTTEVSAPSLADTTAQPRATRTRPWQRKSLFLTLTGKGQGMKGLIQVPRAVTGSTWWPRDKGPLQFQPCHLTVSVLGLRPALSPWRLLGLSGCEFFL